MPNLKKEQPLSTRIHGEASVSKVLRNCFNMLTTKLPTEPEWDGAIARASNVVLAKAIHYPGMGDDRRAALREALAGREVHTELEITKLAEMPMVDEVELGWKPAEELVSCRECGRGNFTVSGLARHTCRRKDVLAKGEADAAAKIAEHMGNLQVFQKDDPIGSLGRALEKLGASVTEAMIAQAWGAVQAAQEDFSLKRLRLGIYLWSRREVLKKKKGQWMKYLRHIAKILGFVDPNCTQIYDLVAYAQRLVMTVAEGKTKSDTIRLRMESLAEGERTALVSLDLDSPAGQAALAKMVGKSSLRELIRDLNESAKTADEMAEKDAKEAAKQKPEEETKEEGEQPPATPGEDGNGQTNFFAELFAAPIAQIKTVYEAHCQEMSDDQILAMEEALQGTLEVVRFRADAARQRQAEAKRQADIAKRKLLTGAK